MKKISSLLFLFIAFVSASAEAQHSAGINPFASTTTLSANEPLSLVSTSTITTSAGQSCSSNGNNKGFITKLYPQFDLGYFVLGNPRSVCIMSNSINLGLVDLDVLDSNSPSIAATYLLRGADVKKISTDPSKGNPAAQICVALGGIESIRGLSWVTKLGGAQWDLCIFSDGSAASAWTISYVSLDPTFLGIRNQIKSKPVIANLPYLRQ